MTDTATRDLEAARRGDEDAFARLVAPHRRELHAHCYRMLGSVPDAEDALQDALVGAWRGLAGFEGRSSLRGWLYRIATHASLRVSERRPRRMAATEHAPSRTDVHDLGAPVTESVFVEPYPDAELADWSGRADPEARYELRESVELAFVAALQALPATQRAVLVLRDVLAMPAAEVADILDTTVPAVNSALQRARATADRRREGTSQQARLRALGDAGRRRLVDDLVRAWERRDVDGVVALLADDARLTMPPFPAWYDGRAAVRRFFAERIFAHRWRVLPTTANAQPALAGYMGDDGDEALPLNALVVISVRDGRIAALDSFLDPAAHRPFPLPSEVPAGDR
ncbi:MAG TPA: RNA polymerase subunit sigma-70 [Acidimicrobiales bacterium]|nr:RNA polymerase subunit sigma-70 [Acidimicrobiales bacterium]